MTKPDEAVSMGDVTWRPPADALTRTRLGGYMSWLNDSRGMHITTYEELWRWSVDDLESFWGSVWTFFSVRDHGRPDCVLEKREMPGARWFPGSLVNYAEQALDAFPSLEHEAVLGISQTRDDVRLTWQELRDEVARARAALKQLGVGRGDRVAGYVPNIPEALVAFLATASLGAVWSSCAPELGPKAVVDRLVQVGPKVVLVAGGYVYGDKVVDCRDNVDAVIGQLPGAVVIDVEYGDFRVPGAASWAGLLAAVPTEGSHLVFEAVPFGHPLVILFTSGTTGRPKAIVHGHGGIMLEHLKNHALSWDMGPGDRMLWFTTTAWMMWNSLVSSLLVGASIVMVDGNPTFPDLGWQWRLARDSGATIMGLSPGFLTACRNAGIEPGAQPTLRTLGSAGAPVPPATYAWVRDKLGADVMFNVGSGGTDVCSGIVQGNPLVPVYAGEISARCLGVDAHAYDDAGEPVTGRLGELVIRAPMPSMPVALWGDDDGRMLRDTYFDRWPGVWRHGDWIEFSAATGACHVAGRSDATLNRGGVRLGTAEFYQVVEDIDGVTDSLVVHLEDDDGGNGQLILFVVVEGAGALEAEMEGTIRRRLRDALSPRHVPDRVIAVPFVPRNLTGKKLELPVKRILMGAAVDLVVSRDSLAAPEALDPFVSLASDFAAKEA